jgi:hypothetical protein
MSVPVIVQIVGAPTVCKEGECMQDAWRKVAAWAGEQLRQRFGEAVEVIYYDLFDPACPSLPANAQLPLVLVNGKVLSSGEIISVPAIRRKIERLVNKKLA